MSEQVPQGMNRREFLTMTGVAASGLVLGGSERDVTLPAPILDCGGAAVHAETQQVRGVVDLLQTPWNIAGVTQEADGTLSVDSIDMTIVGKDNRRLANPPHNAETRLQFDGDFTVSADVAMPKLGKFSLFIANQLPLTYDDFRFPRRGVCFTVDDYVDPDGNPTLSSIGIPMGPLCGVERWDGVHQQPTSSQDIPLENKNPSRTFSLTKHGNRLVAAIDGLEVVIPDDGATFADGTVWLGMMTEGGQNSSHVTRLQAEARGAQPRPITVSDRRTLSAKGCLGDLREWAQRRRPGFLVGAAVAVAPWVGDEQYAALLGGNFSSITTENALKPQFAQPEEGKFTLEEAELLIRLAKNNGMSVHGHALVPNRSMPEWMEAALDGRQPNVMTEHITGIMRRLAGQVRSYDVVNEALARDSAWWRYTKWYEAMGEDFIAQAFQAAHAADPSAELWINDYAMDKDEDFDEARFQTLFAKCKELLRKNIPVTGIGFEGHVYEIPRDSMSPAALTRRMQQLASVGLKARVSEIDVTPANGDGAINNATLAAQAAQFRDIFRACIAAPNCTGFTTWGVGGPYVSTASVGADGRLNDSSNVLWDEKLRQRPAYALMQS